MGDWITECERKGNWQATARRSSGQLVAVIRGRPGSGFDRNFYLYDVDWSPPHPATGGMRPYSADEIKSMFASGELSVVRGAVPK